MQKLIQEIDMGSYVIKVWQYIDYSGNVKIGRTIHLNTKPW